MTTWVAQWVALPPHSCRVTASILRSATVLNIASSFWQVSSILSAFVTPPKHIPVSGVLSVHGAVHNEVMWSLLTVPNLVPVTAWVAKSIQIQQNVLAARCIRPQHETKSANTVYAALKHPTSILFRQTSCISSRTGQLPCLTAMKKDFHCRFVILFHVFIVQ